MKQRRTTAARFSLQFLYKSLGGVGGLAFLFGGRLIHENWKSIDRIFAELIGIGVALVCFFLAYIAKHAIEDLDWEEANERALSEEKPKS